MARARPWSFASAVAPERWSIACLAWGRPAAARQCVGALQERRDGSRRRALGRLRRGASQKAKRPATRHGMDPKLTALERAFQLARSGRVATITELLQALRRDRYDTQQVQGPTLRRQLTALIKAARSAGGPTEGP